MTFSNANIIKNNVVKGQMKYREHIKYISNILQCIVFDTEKTNKNSVTTQIKFKFTAPVLQKRLYH